jgi:glutathione synthase/RimK-type ligase-like ATP-grasp enzyme
MKIIVLAPEDDNHTAPIKWGLERAGFRVVCWAGLSWKEQQQSSMLIGGDHESITIGPHSVDPGDAIWIRRPEPPEPNPNTSEADKKFASLEYRAFYNSIAYMLEKLPVWCINKYSASRAIIQKAVQLQLARKCGMKIPETLMSNSPGTVKNFFARGDRTICKGFTPHVWQKEGQRSVAITETFELTREQLPADDVLTYAPAIYQQLVPKEFDVRMVLMGNHIYSYALTNTKKALDWRQDAGFGHVAVEPIPTPPEVEQSVQAFARQSGICFGSLDFGVDAEGKGWFLEINEQGQFLWLDQFNRGVKTMEKFCAFITAPEGSAEPLEARQDLFPSLEEYEDLLKRELVPPTAKGRPDDPFLSMEA